MNNLLLKIKKYFNSIHNLFKINPHKHWMYLVYIFLVLVSFMILSSFYLLYKIKNNKIFQVEIEQIENKNLLNEDLLKKIDNLYINKGKIEEDIINDIFIYKDPSI